MLKGAQIRQRTGIRSESRTCALNLCALKLLLVTTRQVRSPHPQVAQHPTSLVTLLDVAGPRLHRGALDLLLRLSQEATLLDSIATGHRARGPLRLQGTSHRLQSRWLLSKWVHLVCYQGKQAILWLLCSGLFFPCQRVKSTYLLGQWPKRSFGAQLWGNCMLWPGSV